MIPCATCGSDPSGSFNDGSPRYACRHERPVTPEQAHPAYRQALAATRGISNRITLDAHEQKIALAVAKKVGDRYREGVVATMKYRSRSIEEVNRDGFGAEVAVARWTGLEWNRGHRRKPDVGDDVEVRNTRRADGLLTVYTYDKPERRFVLAIGTFPSYTIVGWLPGRDAVTEAHWRPKGSIVAGYTLDVARFIVPQSELRSPYEILTDALPEASATTEAAAR